MQPECCCLSMHVTFAHWGMTWPRKASMPKPRHELIGRRMNGFDPPLTSQNHRPTLFRSPYLLALEFCLLWGCLC